MGWQMLADGTRIASPRDACVLVLVCCTAHRIPSGCPHVASDFMPYGSEANDCYLPRRSSPPNLCSPRTALSQASLVCLLAVDVLAAVTTCKPEQILRANAWPFSPLVSYFRFRTTRDCLKNGRRDHSWSHYAR